MDIRVATHADIAELERRFPDPHAPATRHAERRQLQEEGKGVYFVAWQAAEPIGWVFLSWQPSAQSEGRRLAEVIDLHVEEPARRQGAGRALLHAAVDASQAASMEGVGLTVTVANPWNDAARALYASEGFADSGAGIFEDGYWYWTSDGEKHWDEEPCRYLAKLFDR